MSRHDHALARQLVQDALGRFSAPEGERHEGDAQLIVLGAILEEVSNGRSRNGRRGNLVAAGSGGSLIAVGAAILRWMGV